MLLLLLLCRETSLPASGAWNCRASGLQRRCASASRRAGRRDLFEHRAIAIILCLFLLLHVFIVVFLFFLVGRPLHRGSHGSMSKFAAGRSACPRRPREVRQNYSSQAEFPSAIWIPLGDLDSLRGSSVKIGTMQRRLVWPLRMDGTQTNIHPKDAGAAGLPAAPLAEGPARRRPPGRAARRTLHISDEFKSAQPKTIRHHFVQLSLVCTNPSACEASVLHIMSLNVDLARREVVRT